MANTNKAAGKKPAAPKKVIFTSKDAEGKASSKYEVKGKTFRFQGKKYTAEEAVKNEELMAALIVVKAPSIVKV